MTTAVSRRIPPQALINLANPVVRGVLLSPLHAALDRSLLVLHVTGRRTGNRYDIPVGYAELDGQLVIVTQHSWRANLRGGAEIEVTHRGHRRRMHAALDEDPASVAKTLEQAIQRMGVQAAQRQFGIKVNVARMPSVSELEAAARQFDLAIAALAPVEV